MEAEEEAEQTREEEDAELPGQPDKEVTEGNNIREGSPGSRG